MNHHLDNIIFTSHLQIFGDKKYNYCESLQTAGASLSLTKGLLAVTLHGMGKTTLSAIILAAGVHGNFEILLLIFYRSLESRIVNC
jgi:hypothetical protein